MAPRTRICPDWPEVVDTSQCALLPHCGLHDRVLEAVQYGDFLQLKGLMRRGARLDMLCPDLPGHTTGNLLDWALHHKNPTAAIRLLKIADGYGLGKWLAHQNINAVYRAAECGHTDVLKELLARGAPVDQCGPIAETDEMRHSALFVAVQLGRKAAAAMLVAAGAWAKEIEREAVLRNARWNDFPGILGMQRAQEIRDAAPRADDLREELQEAILSSDLEGVEAVVRRGASLQRHYSSDKACPHSGYDGSALVNPVDWATLEGCPKAARRLLELEIEKIVTLADGDSLGLSSYRALHIAARRGRLPHWVDLVRKLLDCGADISRVDPWGRSPLHIAVMNGNVEVAQIMLNHGAWDHEQKRHEVLKLAANQRVNCVLALSGYSEAAAFVDSKTSSSGSPVSQESAELDEVHERDLVKAIKVGDMIKIKVLVGRDANLLMLADLGYGIRGNLIDVAVFHRRENIALLLLQLASEKGIARDLVVSTCHAVFWAVQRDFMQLLKELLKYGANAGQSDGICGSALRFAAEQSRSDAIVLLLEAGAWQAETEKELVYRLIHDRKLLQGIDFASGRGIGTSDQDACERLKKVAQDMLREGSAEV